MSERKSGDRVLVEAIINDDMGNYATCKGGKFFVGNFAGTHPHPGVDIEALLEELELLNEARFSTGGQWHVDKDNRLHELRAAREAANVSDPFVVQIRKRTVLEQKAFVDGARFAVKNGITLDAIDAHQRFMEAD